MSGIGNLGKMRDLATDLVMDQAMKDKLAQHEEQEAFKKQRVDAALKDTKTKFSDAGSDDDIGSDDSFFDGMDLDDEEVLRKMKEKRISEYEHMKDEGDRKIKRDTEGYGEYIEIDEEKFMNYTTTQKFVVCHFSHNDFLRCKIMDKHLRLIARDHPECKFYHLNVQRSPFIVKKLNIRMLPTVGVFIDGILIE